MSHDRCGKTLLTAALLLGCAAVPLTSQALSHGERTPATGAGQAPAAVASTLSQDDRSFIQQAAQGGMAEVEMGQLAEQRAQSAKVKAFGQRMVRDHSQADRKLDAIASSKGVTLPAGLDAKAQAQYDRLQKLSGADFDREYMAAMVADHQKDIGDFRQEAGSAKDSDVRDFAKATLPTLEAHLKVAKSTAPDAGESAQSNAQAGKS